MTKLQTQNIIDLNKVRIDPLICASCIDWSEIHTSSAHDDWEQGKMLVAETFIDINWQEYAGSITQLISGILKTLPQDRQYQYVTQGFSDTLVSNLMKIVKKRHI